MIVGRIYLFLFFSRAEDESGIQMLEDGNFMFEIPGLPEGESADVMEAYIGVKRNTKVRFSTNPIKVFVTFKVISYIVDCSIGNSIN